MWRFGLAMYHREWVRGAARTRFTAHAYCVLTVVALKQHEGMRNKRTHHQPQWVYHILYIPRSILCFFFLSFNDKSSSSCCFFRLHFFCSLIYALPLRDQRARPGQKTHPAARSGTTYYRKDRQEWVCHSAATAASWNREKAVFGENRQQQKKQLLYSYTTSSSKRQACRHVFVVPAAQFTWPWIKRRACPGGSSGLQAREVVSIRSLLSPRGYNSASILGMSRWCIKKGCPPPEARKTRKQNHSIPEYSQ